MSACVRALASVVVAEGFLLRSHFEPNVCLTPCQQRRSPLSSPPFSQRRQHMTVQEIIDANAREARKCEEQIAAGIPVQPVRRACHCAVIVPVIVPVCWDACGGCL